MSDMGGARSVRRVWDFPIRLVHWLLVLLIAFAWWSAEKGPGIPSSVRADLEADFPMGFMPWIEWHRWSGYAILGLIVFRILWGLFGSETARFGSFLKGPRAICGYLKKLGSKSSDVAIGHNPLGGWSVFAMVLLIVLQTILGLFAVDMDGIESGPMSVFISYDAGRLAASLHEAVFNILLVFIILHLVAILFYGVFKRDNLIGPMITGRRMLNEHQEAPSMAPFWVAIIFALLAAGAVYAVMQSFWLV